MTIRVTETGISPYGLCMVLSFVLGYVFIVLQLKKDQIEKKIIFYSVMLSLSCSIYLAVAYTIIFSDAFGFSSIGGALGIIIGMLIMGAISKPNREAIYRRYIQSLPLLYGVSKLGCFFAGCCYGIAYDGPCSLTYIGTRESLPQGAVFPIQLLESIVFLGIFIGTCFFAKKYANVLTIAICCAAKFGLDYLRASHVDQVISVNQIFCILILIGTLIYASVRKRRRSAHHPDAPM